MKPLYSSEQFNLSKSRDLLPLECEYCHETFNASKNNIQWAIKRADRNCLKLCSNKCRIALKDKRKSVCCHLCKKSIKHTYTQLKTNKYHFCSNSCSTKYWNTHKTWGSPRSKLELWIEENLTKTYPYIKIEYNNRKEINSELDIYIPSLKLAFELNGIFHYEPIYGKDNLNKVQNNDRRKFQACLEKNIELCIIDTHNVKYLKKDRDQKFMNIITNIINMKMEEGTEHDSDAHLRHV